MPEPSGPYPDCSSVIIGRRAQVLSGSQLPWAANAQRQGQNQSQIWNSLRLVDLEPSDQFSCRVAALISGQAPYYNLLTVAEKRPKNSGENDESVWRYFQLWYLTPCWLPAPCEVQAGFLPSLVIECRQYWSLFSSFGPSCSRVSFQNSGRGTTSCWRC